MTIKLSARSCSYWRSRAITAEQKVLEFHEQIALLGAPARDGVRNWDALKKLLSDRQLEAAMYETTEFSSGVNEAAEIVYKWLQAAAKEQADGQP